MASKVKKLTYVVKESYTMSAITKSTNQMVDIITLLGKMPPYHLEKCNLNLLENEAGVKL